MHDVRPSARVFRHPVNDPGARQRPQVVGAETRSDDSRNGGNVSMPSWYGENEGPEMSRRERARLRDEAARQVLVGAVRLIVAPLIVIGALFVMLVWL